MIVKAQRERWDLMHHVIHTSAYVLNPKPGNNLSVLDDRKLLSDIEKVFQSLKAGTQSTVYACMVLTEKFLNHENPFHDERLFTKPALNMSVLEWWETWKIDSECGFLRDVALQVFSTSYTTSTCERNLSIWGYVNNKLRNKLYPENTEKVVFCYQSMCML